MVSRQTAYFAPSKHLELKEPEISAQVKVENETAHITLTAASLSRLVELTFEGEEAVFSDNYFDLPQNDRSALLFLFQLAGRKQKSNPR